MIERTMAPRLRTALADTPVVLLHGARQTGKSTLVRMLAEERGMAYATLDEAVHLAAAQRDPDAFLDGFERPLVIDEVQRVPELLRAIKVRVDRDRVPGMYLLTGSANTMLLPRVAESLAGRIEVLTLHPFTQSELRGTRGAVIDQLYAARPTWQEGTSLDPAALAGMLCTGGYPEAVGRRHDDRRTAWFQSYVTTILQRDVRDISNIEGLTALPRLLELLAARTGGLSNLASLAGDAGMPQTTLRRYLALLMTTFLVAELPPWSRNLGLRMVRTPKLYIADPGLAAALLHMAPARFDLQPVLRGALLETFVHAELQRLISWSATHPRLYFLRTHNGSEVDFLLERGDGQIVAIELKAASTVHPIDFRALEQLRDALGPTFIRGILLYTGSERIPFGKQLAAHPLSMLWQ